MIICVFQQGTDIYKIRIYGYNLIFSKIYGNNERHTTIDGLQLSVAGILKHYPDLEGKEPMEMRIEAIKRFKEKLKEMKSEEEVKNYLKEDLSPYGFKLLRWQKSGFRWMNEKQNGNST